MIYIVIPVYNRREFTRNCLNALKDQTYLDFTTVVVDDGSTDGTEEMLAESFPDVKVLHEKGNLYWTAAVNIGIRFALSHGADHILTLNNDTIPAPNFMANMIAWSDRKPEALLCSFEYDIKTGRPCYGGELVNWTWASSRYLLDELAEDAHRGLHAVSLAPGRGLLVPRNVFKSIGLFDERHLPHYLADFDFTCRAKRRGFEIFCNYDAKLFVYVDESGDKQILREKNFKNYYNHLFGIKGAGNLKNFSIYTVRNSPIFMIPFQLLIGYTKRILNYLYR
ncbi:MAG TPA: glycosyltransferase family 2 protein [Chryseosolibacter sp.]